MKRAAGPQIAPVYGNDFRSTPVFFLQDDHDYFDNDEATDEVVTFPPSYFMLQLARATQNLYYPEFLPDAERPLGLPWSSAGDRARGVSESFGTLRFGRLAEILLYDVRRTQTLAGPSAVYLDPEVEKWLKARTASTEVSHVVHVPSNPPGWTAGKWGEWYPDVLGRDGKLTANEPKPYWQPGWLKQHDRLMQAISGMKGRVPLVIRGDLHAIAIGRMLRSGSLDLKANPVNVVLSGPIGSRPGPLGRPAGAAPARSRLRISPWRSRSNRSSSTGLPSPTLRMTRSFCGCSNGTSRRNRWRRLTPSSRSIPLSCLDRYDWNPDVIEVVRWVREKADGNELRPNF